MYWNLLPANNAYQPTLFRFAPAERSDLHLEDFSTRTILIQFSLCSGWLVHTLLAVPRSRATSMSSDVSTYSGDSGSMIDSRSIDADGTVSDFNTLPHFMERPGHQKQLCEHCSTLHLESKTPSQLIIAVMSPTFKSISLKTCHGGSRPSSGVRSRFHLSPCFEWWIRIIIHCTLMLLILVLTFILLQRQPLLSWASYLFCISQSCAFIWPLSIVIIVTLSTAFVGFSLVQTILIWVAACEDRVPSMGEKEVVLILLCLQAAAAVRWCI